MRGRLFALSAVVAMFFGGVVSAREIPEEAPSPGADCKFALQILPECLEVPERQLVTPDREQVSRLLSKAFTGSGRDATPTLSVELLRAAHMGDNQAQFMLGIVFAQGHGIEQDEERALDWLAFAAESGNEYAEDYALGILLRARNLERALPLLEDRAERGEKFAIISLSTTLAREIRSPEGLDRAVSILEPLVEEGDVDAIVALFFLISDVSLPVFNPDRAQRLYTQAMEAGEALDEATRGALDSISNQIMRK